PVEHFGIRAPALADKQVLPEGLAALPVETETERELRREWGARIPLAGAENHNCWLIGAGGARFAAGHLILAYLNFPTPEAANAGIGTRHRPHFHRRSREVYLTLRGSQTLRIGGELVRIEAGELLEVPPGVSHALQGREVPYEGFTLRAPLDLHDRVEVEDTTVSEGYTHEQP
ncbi:MAG: cupin domain-containing protein, partial [Chloroflexi bacterium]|nr:cupin domain-containing protein [Chloroflexota bacterium]